MLISFRMAIQHVSGTLTRTGTSIEVTHYNGMYTEMKGPCLRWTYIEAFVQPTLSLPTRLEMLFIILIYYLTQAVFIGASPLSLISIDNRSSESNPCSDLNHCRTMWGIVWSCLTTVYSCTWVAVHPNIPCPRKKESNDCFQRWVWNPLLFFVEHRLPLFVCAVMVPEYILAWAIRQWLKARQIDKENKGE